MRRFFTEITSAGFFDLNDQNTRETLNSLIESEQTPIVEAEQNSVILSLTNKLYRMIVDKVDDIDFGEIPDTKGDITKLSKYDELCACVQVMKDLIEQYKQDTKPIEEIERAIANMRTLTPTFTRGYIMNIEIVQVMYCEIALSIVNSISFMISACIEYVKLPNADGFQLALDKKGIARTRDSLVYHALCEFNKAHSKGQVVKAFEPFIRAKARNVVGADDLAVVAGIFAVGAILMNILPILRELTFFFYAVRTRISDYFDVQADLLEMNAKEIEMNKSVTVDDRDKVVKRQKAISEFFRKVANKICIDQVAREKTADKEMQQANKKLKYEDVENKETLPSGHQTTPKTDDSIF